MDCSEPTRIKHGVAGDGRSVRLCGNCGYDLRGSTTPRCSECGAAFDPAERPTEPAEVVATIYKSLGFDIETALPGPAGRPFPLVDFGKHEIKELF